MILFPFYDYWWFYTAFTVFVLIVLALDLGVFHKNAHEVSFKRSIYLDHYLDKPSFCF